MARENRGVAGIMRGIVQHLHGREADKKEYHGAKDGSA